MERTIGQSVPFEPVATFRYLYRGEPSFARLLNDLGSSFALAQRRNAAWSEQQLVALRSQRSEPLLDILLADENGNVVNAFSSYWSFASNAEFALTVPDLANNIKRRQRMVYPLTGQNDSTFFWLDDHDVQVVAALGKYFPEIHEEGYRNTFRDAKVRFFRAHKGVAGKAKFADEGIVFGNLGFWVNSRLALGFYGAGRYIQRVRFEPTSLIPETVFVSPLDPDKIKSKGGQLLDEKHSGIKVVRVDSGHSPRDFISLALLNSPAGDLPTLLRYTTLRPWLGEIPKHGEIT